MSAFGRSREASVRRVLGILCALGLCVASGRAQLGGIDPWPRAEDEIEALVAAGRVDELEQKVASRALLDRNHLLARAGFHRARQTSDGAQRAALLDRAEALFKEWLDALEKAARRGEVRPMLHLVEGRILYANSVLALRVDPELVDFEASGGKFGDRAALRALLDTCRAQYRKAEREMAPYIERGTEEEDQVLLENLEEEFQNARLDLTMNLGWTHQYLGAVYEGPLSEKRVLHAQAERAFNELIGLEVEGTMKAICYLALAMAQRDQGRMNDASRNFDTALRSTPRFEIQARVRYEYARGQLAEQTYEALRETLEPLTARDPRDLAQSELGGRLYMQLAHLLGGASYLLQAQAVVKQRQDEIARTQAQRLRETGLARLKVVSSWGPPWPALVRFQIAAGADLETPPESLTPLELLCTAQVLSGGGQPQAALQRLSLAARGDTADDELKGDILYELGRVQYQLDDRRSAAATFDKLVGEHKRHLRAAQAATFAFQLWGRVAEQTKQPADYLQLAESLQRLLTSFAQHPSRDEALWLLPRALQLAGRFDEAAPKYAELPESHPRWEEAQYRRTLCARDALAAVRKDLDADTLRTRASEVASLLIDYAKDARGRTAAKSGDPLTNWSAEAVVAAGELLISSGVDASAASPRALASFEADYPRSPLLGRVLAVRIRALRGAQQFDDAGKLLAEYLRTADAAEVGPTLTSLARGMQDEVERLVAAGAEDDARRLAGEAAATFSELEKWVAREGRREGQLELVQRGRLEMCYLAGDYATALKLVDELLARNPRSGPQQHRRAAILSAMLPVDAPREQIESAQKAWATVLADESIRRRAPERYWEARYNWLRLHARLGHAQETADAIFEESRWRPDLGGAAWRPRLEALYRETGGTRSLEREAPPATSQASGASE